jgi:predicted PurR-regulated permease PerM
MSARLLTARNHTKLIMKDSTKHTSAAKAEEGWLSRERVLALILISATAIVFYLCYLITQPFLPALAWAMALAVLTYPLYRRIESRVRRPNLAAAISVLIVLLVIVGPSAFVVRQLGSELATTVDFITNQTETGRWWIVLERNPSLAPAVKWIEQHLDLRGEVQQAADAITSRIPSFLTGSAWALAELLVTLFVLFYLFRDKQRVLGAVRHVLPLSDTEVKEMFSRISDTIHATVYGTVIVALVQGVLGGLMFWWLGLPTPMLWGVVMALLAIVPVLGAFVVWVPAAIFLALEGNWGKALILTGWGGIVIALIDNLLYPILVGTKLRLHTVPVFIAIIGGLTVFGAAGVILGPVVFAVALGLIDVWRRRTAHGRAAENGVHS